MGPLLSLRTAEAAIVLYSSGTIVFRGTPLQDWPDTCWPQRQRLTRITGAAHVSYARLRNAVAQTD